MDEDNIPIFGIIFLIVLLIFTLCYSQSATNWTMRKTGQTFCESYNKTFAYTDFQSINGEFRFVCNDKAPPEKLDTIGIIGINK